MDKETLAVMELLPTFSQMQSEAWRSLPPTDAHAVGALSTSQLKAVMLIAMRELADGEAMTLGELADAIALKKSATSILVTALEDAGLAVRKADACNGRKVRIRLSAKGGCLARRITAGAARRVAQFLGTLTASERGTFVSVARKFTAFARCALVVAVLAACVGCDVAPRPAPKSRALVLHGNVDDRELKLAFVISERLARVVPEEGASVRKGDIVATRAVSQQDSDDAEAAYFFLAHAEEAATALLARLVAGDRVEDRQAAAARKAAAEAALSEAKARLAVARQRVEDATLRAPADGVVRERILEPGEWTAPQKPVLTLARTDPKWVRCYVRETDLVRVPLGAKAKILADSRPQPFDGWVGYISPTAEFTPKNIETDELRPTLVYETRIYVKDPLGELKLGTPVTVTL